MAGIQTLTWLSASRTIRRKSSPLSHLVVIVLKLFVTDAELARKFVPKKIVFQASVIMENTPHT
jgi:hypothetical protein